jgi:uncharacterized membrane protein
MIERRMLLWLFAACSCVLLLIHNGLLSGLDGETFYQVAKSAIDAHRLDVGPGFNSTTGVGGMQYAKSGIGMPLLAAVVYAVSAPVAWMAPSHGYTIRTGIVGASMTFIMAALVVAVYWLARQLRSNPGAALITAIGTVAGTFLLPYSKEFLGEPLSALGLAVAIGCALNSRPAAAGAGLAVAMLARPQTVLVLAPLMWVVLRRSGMKGALATAGPIAAGAALTVAYNMARYGNPLEFGYPSEGFTMPFLSGAHMLLLEPSKSVILFVPVTVLLPFALVGLWRRNRQAALLISSTAAITFVVAALWHNPNGGWSWGPRLLIPAIPSTLAALGPWMDTPLRRRLAIVLFALGFAVSAPAVAVSTQIQQLDVPPPAGGVWPPDMGLPRIGRQAELVPPTAAYTVDHLFERKEDGRNYLRYMAFWQVGLARVLGPRGLLLAIAASLGLFTLAAWAANRCRRAYLALPSSSLDTGQT